MHQKSTEKSIEKSLKFNRDLKHNVETTLDPPTFKGHFPHFKWVWPMQLVHFNLALVHVNSLCNFCVHVLIIKGK